METITDCIVASVPLPNVISLIGNDQAATLLFMRLLSTNEAIAFQHLSNIGLRSARERVACLIYELSRRAQLSSYRGRLPIKQVHIADALGLTNEHVCRTLKSLREDGLLAIDNNGISVLDIDELASEACASDDDAIVWANRYFDPDIYARGASNERSM
jgi:CRP/FNR family transcriptional regulator, anaerobic regulatory protein